MEIIYKPRYIFLLKDFDRNFKSNMDKYLRRFVGYKNEKYIYFTCGEEIKNLHSIWKIDTAKVYNILNANIKIAKTAVIVSNSKNRMGHNGYFFFYHSEFEEKILKELEKEESLEIRKIINEIKITWDEFLIREIII